MLQRSFYCLMKETSHWRMVVWSANVFWLEVFFSSPGLHPAGQYSGCFIRNKIYFLRFPIFRGALLRI